MPAPEEKAAILNELLNSAYEVLNNAAGFPVEESLFTVILVPVPTT